MADMNIPGVFIVAIETAFNRYLALDKEGSQQLGILEGKVIELRITGLNLSLFLFPSTSEMMILEQFDGEADAVITGPPLAFADLALSEDKQTKMFDGEIKVTGDTRVARQFNEIFSRLDIDWEELASKVVGDTLAHQLSNLGKDLLGLYKRNSRSFKLDTGEYLQEEVNYLPSESEVNDFINDVDVLRNDIARLDARISRLEQVSNTARTNNEE